MDDTNNDLKCKILREYHTIERRVIYGYIILYILNMMKFEEYVSISNKIENYFRLRSMSEFYNYFSTDTNFNVSEREREKEKNILK